MKLLDSWKSNERERSPVSSVLLCNFSDPVKNVSEHAVTISTLYTCILNMSPISITFCITMCTNTIEWITLSMLNMFEHEKNQTKRIRDNSYDFFGADVTFNLRVLFMYYSWVGVMLPPWNEFLQGGVSLSHQCILDNKEMILLKLLLNYDKKSTVRFQRCVNKIELRWAQVNWSALLAG